MICATHTNFILIAEEKKTPACAGVKSSGFSEGRQNLREGIEQQTVKRVCYRRCRTLSNEQRARQ
jgi:hypothetical protein